MIIYYYFKMILISIKLFSKTMKLTPPQTIFIDTGSDDIVYNHKNILLVVRKQARSSLR